MANTGPARCFVTVPQTTRCSANLPPSDTRDVSTFPTAIWQNSRSISDVVPWSAQFGTWNSFQDNGSINSKATVAPHRVAFHDLTCWRLDLCLRIRPGVRPAMKTCRPSTCQRKHSFKICPKKRRGEAHNSSDAARIEKHSNEPQKHTETNHRTHQFHQISPASALFTTLLLHLWTSRLRILWRLQAQRELIAQQGSSKAFPVPVRKAARKASCRGNLLLPAAWLPERPSLLFRIPWGLHWLVAGGCTDCQNMSCDLSTMLKNQGKTTTARTASTVFQHIQHLSNSASLLGRIDTEAEVLFCHSFENDHYLDHGRCAQTWLAQFWRPIPAKLLTRQRKLHLRNLTLPMTWTPRLICGYAATHGYTVLRC